MNQRFVVTAGAKGADIDVLACAVAYAELLRLEGHDALAVVPGEFTSSVTPSILAWDCAYEKEYAASGNESYVLVDISDPEHLPQFVVPTSIVEVYDHRYGHEEYWQERLGADAHIEMVGACGTLIWEAFVKRGQSQHITQSSARLLLASIVSNNLNFKSQLLTDRDVIAYDTLKAIANVPDNWIEQYFVEQEKILLGDFVTYVSNDTKSFKLGATDFVIGQIEMWNASSLLTERTADILHVMEPFAHLPWLMNILSIAEGKNYIYSTSAKGKDMLERVMNVKFVGDVAETDELFLRKHLMKLLKGL